MALYSCFTSAKLSVSGDSVVDHIHGMDPSLLSESGQNNVLYHRFETVSLDDDDTRTISFANYATSEWVGIVAQVFSSASSTAIGEARINIVAKDTDGSTDIASAPVGYGNKLHPGLIMLSTYNVTSFQLEGLADDTTVVLWAMIFAEDDDSRLTTNA